MEKQKKIFLAILILAVIAVGAWYGIWGKGKSSQVSHRAVVKIGVILPLTGNTAFMGESCRKAMVMAQEQLGNTKYDYQLIFEDDGMDKIKTASAFSKLANIDKVDAVVSWSSGSGNVVSPMAEQNKIIHFGIASDANVAKGDYNFTHLTPPESEAVKMVQELVKRQISKIALVGLNQEGVVATFNFLRSKMAGAGIEIVFDALLSGEQMDFKTEIQKIKNAKPQIVVLEFFSPQIEIFASQAKELGLDIPLTAIEAFEFSERPELFNGLWYVQVADPTNDFVKLYQEKYNDEPKLGAANGFDVFNLLMKGFEIVGQNQKVKPVNEEVIKALEQIKDFPGAVGLISVLPESGIVWSEAEVRMIKDGKPITVN
ncbi:MAG: ABC transporter substrate-binding protein [Candidatus Pacebacteria bacterium]|nr:ABC transporter substrate-binding protein [Candidatus Paceibacterota bacterium]